MRALNRLMLGVVVAIVAFGATLLAMRQHQALSWRSPAPAAVQLGTMPAAHHTPAPSADNDLTPAGIEVPSPEPLSRPVEFQPGLGARQRFKRAIRFHPPIEPVDTRSFEADGQIIVIADMETPVFSAVCRDENKNLWACGLMTRAALFNRIPSGVLECRPRRSQAGAALGWACQHNGEDVALWMIRSGWARPLPESPIHYATAVQAAQQEKRGLSNGNWSLVSSSPIAPAPTAPLAAEAHPRKGATPAPRAGAFLR